MNFKKIISIITTACFLVTFAGQNLSWANTPKQQNSVIDEFKKVFENIPKIPVEYGKITNVTDLGSKTIVVNIQDLHCHPEAQRSIAKIIDILDKNYKVKNIYVEGAYDNVDISWLTNISEKEMREAIIENLLEDGRLNASEYYAVKNNKKEMLLGLEDEEKHKENIKRLGYILEKQEVYADILAEIKNNINYLDIQYTNDRNKRFNRILDRYKEGRISEEKFYALLQKYINKINAEPEKYNNVLPIKFSEYPNIQNYVQFMKLSSKINMKQVYAQLQSLLALLKEKLPKEGFQLFLDKTDNLANIDMLSMSLTNFCEIFDLNLDINYKQLNMFFKNQAISRSINPLDMIQEERHLIERLRASFSYDQTEYEISFLNDFYGYFSDYLQNKLMADDFAYFTSRFGQFRELYAKYSIVNSVDAVSSDFDLLHSYYNLNDQRNKIFINNLFKYSAPDCSPAQNAQKRKADDCFKDAEEVIIAVTGGYHSIGLQELLKEKGITNIIVTPTVTTELEGAEKIYERIVLEQSIFLRQALAFTIASQSTTQEQFNLITSAGLSYLNDAMSSRSFDFDRSIKILEGIYRDTMGVRSISSVRKEGNDYIIDFRIGSSISSITIQADKGKLSLKKSDLKENAFDEKGNLKPVKLNRRVQKAKVLLDFAGKLAISSVKVPITDSYELIKGIFVFAENRRGLTNFKFTYGPTIDLDAYANKYGLTEIDGVNLRIVGKMPKQMQEAMMLKDQRARGLDEESLKRADEQRAQAQAAQEKTKKRKSIRNAVLGTLAAIMLMMPLAANVSDISTDTAVPQQTTAIVRQIETETPSEPVMSALPQETVTEANSQTVLNMSPQSILSALNNNRDMFDGSLLTENNIRISIEQSNSPEIQQRINTCFELLQKHGILDAGQRYPVLILNGWEAEEFAMAYIDAGFILIPGKTFDSLNAFDQLKFLLPKVAHEGTHLNNKGKNITRLEDEADAFEATTNALKVTQDDLRTILRESGASRSEIEEEMSKLNGSGPYQDYVSEAFKFMINNKSTITDIVGPLAGQPAFSDLYYFAVDVAPTYNGGNPNTVKVPGEEISEESVIIEVYSENPQYRNISFYLQIDTAKQELVRVLAVNKDTGEQNLSVFLQQQEPEHQRIINSLNEHLAMQPQERTAAQISHMTDDRFFKAFFGMNEKDLRRNAEASAEMAESKELQDLSDAVYKKIAAGGVKFSHQYTLVPVKGATSNINTGLAVVDKGFLAFPEELLLNEDGREKTFEEKVDALIGVVTHEATHIESALNNTDGTLSANEDEARAVEAGAKVLNTLFPTMFPESFLNEQLNLAAAFRSLDTGSGFDLLFDIAQGREPGLQGLAYADYTVPYAYNLQHPGNPMPANNVTIVFNDPDNPQFHYETEFSVNKKGGKREASIVSVTVTDNEGTVLDKVPFYGMQSNEDTLEMPKYAFLADKYGYTGFKRLLYISFVEMPHTLRIGFGTKLHNSATEEIRKKRRNGDLAIKGATLAGVAVAVALGVYFVALGPWMPLMIPAFAVIANMGMHMAYNATRWGKEAKLETDVSQMSGREIEAEISSLERRLLELGISNIPVFAVRAVSQQYYKTDPSNPYGMNPQYNTLFMVGVDAKTFLQNYRFNEEVTSVYGKDANPETVFLKMLRNTFQHLNFGDDVSEPEDDYELGLTPVFIAFNEDRFLRNVNSESSNEINYTLSDFENAVNERYAPSQRWYSKTGGYADNGEKFSVALNESELAMLKESVRDYMRSAEVTAIAAKNRLRPEAMKQYERLLTGRYINAYLYKKYLENLTDETEKAAQQQKEESKKSLMLDKGKIGLFSAGYGGDRYPAVFFDVEYKDGRYSIVNLSDKNADKKSISIVNTPDGFYFESEYTDITADEQKDFFSINKDEVAYFSNSDPAGTPVTFKVKFINGQFTITDLESENTTVKSTVKIVNTPNGFYINSYYAPVSMDRTVNAKDDAVFKSNLPRGPTPYEETGDLFSASMLKKFPHAPLLEQAHLKELAKIGNDLTSPIPEVRERARKILYAAAEMPRERIKIRLNEGEAVSAAGVVEELPFSSYHTGIDMPKAYFDIELRDGEYKVVNALYVSKEEITITPAGDGYVYIDSPYADTRFSESRSIRDAGTEEILLLDAKTVGERIESPENRLPGEITKEQLGKKDFNGRKFSKIVGFTTFSGNTKGVLDNREAERHIEEYLNSLVKEHGKENVLVVCGATDFGGVHNVYNVAQRMGLATMGLVAKAGILACPQDIRKCDYYYIEEEVVPWEGADAGDWGSESPKFVNLIDELFAFGGGAQAVEEIQNVAVLNKTVQIMPDVKTTFTTTGQAEASIFSLAGIRSQDDLERQIESVQMKIDSLGEAETAQKKAFMKELKELNKSLALKGGQGVPNINFIFEPAKKTYKSVFTLSDWQKAVFAADFYTKYPNVTFEVELVNGEYKITNINYTNTADNIRDINIITLPEGGFLIESDYDDVSLSHITAPQIPENAVKHTLNDGEAAFFQADFDDRYPSVTFQVEYADGKYSLADLKINTVDKRYVNIVQIADDFYIVSGYNDIRLSKTEKMPEKAKEKTASAAKETSTPEEYTDTKDGLRKLYGVEKVTEIDTSDAFREGISEDEQKDIISAAADSIAEALYRGEPVAILIDKNDRAKTYTQDMKEELVKKYKTVNSFASYISHSIASIAYERGEINSFGIYEMIKNAIVHGNNQFLDVEFYMHFDRATDEVKVINDRSTDKEESLRYLASSFYEGGLHGKHVGEMYIQSTGEYKLGNGELKNTTEASLKLRKNQLTMTWLKKLLDTFGVKDFAKRQKIVAAVEKNIIILGIFFPAVRNWFLGRHHDMDENQLEKALSILERRSLNASGITEMSVLALSDMPGLSLHKKIATAAKMIASRTVAKANKEQHIQINEAFTKADPSVPLEAYSKKVNDLRNLKRAINHTEQIALLGQGGFTRYNYLDFMRETEESVSAGDYSESDLREIFNDAEYAYINIMRNSDNEDFMTSYIKDSSNPLKSRLFAYLYAQENEFEVSEKIIEAFRKDFLDFLRSGKDLGINNAYDLRASLAGLYIVLREAIPGIKSADREIFFKMFDALLSEKDENNNYIADSGYVFAEYDLDTLAHELGHNILSAFKFSSRTEASASIHETFAFAIEFFMSGVVNNGDISAVLHSLDYSSYEIYDLVSDADLPLFQNEHKIARSFIKLALENFDDSLENGALIYSILELISAGEDFTITQREIYKKLLEIFAGQVSTQSESSITKEEALSALERKNIEGNTNSKAVAEIFSAITGDKELIREILEEVNANEYIAKEYTSYFRSRDISLTDKSQLEVLILSASQNDLESIIDIITDKILKKGDESFYPSAMRLLLRKNSIDNEKTAIFMDGLNDRQRIEILRSIALKYASIQDDEFLKTAYAGLLKAYMHGLPENIKKGILKILTRGEKAHVLLAPAKAGSYSPAQMFVYSLINIKRVMPAAIMSLLLTVGAIFSPDNRAAAQSYNIIKPAAAPLAAALERLTNPPAPVFDFEVGPIENIDNSAIDEIIKKFREDVPEVVLDPDIIKRLQTRDNDNSLLGRPQNASAGNRQTGQSSYTGRFRADKLPEFLNSLNYKQANRVLSIIADTISGKRFHTNFELAPVDIRDFSEADFEAFERSSPAAMRFTAKTAADDFYEEEESGKQLTDAAEALIAALWEESGSSQPIGNTIFERLRKIFKDDTPVTIAFICSANFNRSAIPEIMLKHKLGEMGKNNINIVSGGAFYEMRFGGGRETRDRLRTEHVQELTSRYGIGMDLIDSFTSKQFTREQAEADIIIAADDRHKEYILETFASTEQEKEELGKKIFLFNEIVPDVNDVSTVLDLRNKGNAENEVNLVEKINRFINRLFDERAAGQQEKPNAILPENIEMVNRMKEEGKSNLSIARAVAFREFFKSVLHPAEFYRAHLTAEGKVGAARVIALTFIIAASALLLIPSMGLAAIPLGLVAGSTANLVYHTKLDYKYLSSPQAAIEEDKAAVEKNNEAVRSALAKSLTPKTEVALDFSRFLLQDRDMEEMKPEIEAYIKEALNGADAENTLLSIVFNSEFSSALYNDEQLPKKYKAALALSDIISESIINMFKEKNPDLLMTSSAICELFTNAFVHGNRLDFRKGIYVFLNEGTEVSVINTISPKSIPLKLLAAASAAEIFGFGQGVSFAGDENGLYRYSTSELSDGAENHKLFIADIIVDKKYRPFTDTIARMDQEFTWQVQRSLTRDATPKAIVLPKMNEGDTLTAKSMDYDDPAEDGYVDKVKFTLTFRNGNYEITDVERSEATKIDYRLDHSGKLEIVNENGVNYLLSPYMRIAFSQEDSSQPARTISAILPQNIDMVNEMAQEGKGAFAMAAAVSFKEFSESLLHPVNFLRSHKSKGGAIALLAATYLSAIATAGIALFFPATAIAAIPLAVAAGALVNIKAHIIINYHFIKSSGLTQAVKEFGSEAKLNEKGYISLPVYVINDQPADYASLNFVNSGVKIKGNTLWIGEADNAIVVFAKDSSYADIAQEMSSNRTLNDKIRKISQKDVKIVLGREKVAVDWIGVNHDDDSDYIGYSANGNIQASYSVYKQMLDRGEIQEFSASLRTVRNVDATVFAQGILHNLDDISTMQEFIEYLEQHQKIGNGQIVINYEVLNELIVDIDNIKGAAKAAAFIAFLLEARKSGVQVFVNIEGAKNQRRLEKELEKLGSAGYVSVNAKTGKIELFNYFLRSASEVGSISDFNSVEDLENEIKSSSGTVMISNKALRRIINAERSGMIINEIVEILSSTKILKLFTPADITPDFAMKAGRNFVITEMPDLSKIAPSETAVSELVQKAAEGKIPAEELKAMIIGSGAAQSNAVLVYLAKLESQTRGKTAGETAEIFSAFAAGFVERMLAADKLKKAYKPYGLKDRNYEIALGKALFQQVLQGTESKGVYKSHNDLGGTMKQAEEKLAEELSSLLAQAFDNNDPIAINTLVELIPPIAEEELRMEAKDIRPALNMKNVEKIMAAA